MIIKLSGTMMKTLVASNWQEDEIAESIALVERTVRGRLEQVPGLSFTGPFEATRTRDNEWHTWTWVAWIELELSNEITR